MDSVQGLKDNRVLIMFLQKELEVSLKLFLEDEPEETRSSPQQC